MNKEQQLMNCRTFDELLDVEYGESGTPKRNEFENGTQLFCLATTLKEERLKTGLTQQKLAERIGTKKLIFPVWKTVKLTCSSTPSSVFSKV